MVGEGKKKEGRRKRTKKWGRKRERRKKRGIGKYKERKASVARALICKVITVA